MTSLPRAKASEILPDGGLAQIPGVADAGKGLPILIQSDSVNMETAVARQGHFVCPCDLKIVGALLNVIEQLGTGAGTIGAGTMADTNGLVADYSVAISVTAGTIVDLTSDASFTGAALYNTVIPKGTVIVFQSDGGATTTGEACLLLIAVPV